MQRFLKILLFVLVLTGLGTWVLWATSPDPKYNIASFEDEPLKVGIAPFEDASTLTQMRDSMGIVHTLVVVSYDGESIEGIDLESLGGTRHDDLFESLASVPPQALYEAVREPNPNVQRVAVSDLLPAGSSGDRHIGIGTNFPEHAEEASSTSVFFFPKFGKATPARTTVQARPGELLDYEVEFCMRFDRPIRSVEDFNAAQKGLFLCGDFTNRVDLLELADFDNLDSGYGFSDAKSGADFFPTGPFVVIPRDWKHFSANLRMTTDVNDEPRQDARGGEMTLDFRGLAEGALGDMEKPRFYYKGNFYHLAPDQIIKPDMTLMSGTAEGVIFTPPMRGDYIEIVLAYLKAGGPLSGRSLIENGIPVFIENELASGHYLQPGDTVRYRSTFLGEIIVEVVE